MSFQWGTKEATNVLEATQMETAQMETALMEAKLEFEKWSWVLKNAVGENRFVFIILIFLNKMFELWKRCESH
jgi:hypothetical protein